LRGVRIFPAGSLGPAWVAEMMSPSHFRHANFFSCTGEVNLDMSTAVGRLDATSSAIRPPPGLDLLPPPGLSLAPPAGLELQRPWAVENRTSATKCGRDGSKCGSDCSTADASEAGSTTSPLITPRGSSPAAPELGYAAAPLEAEVLARANVQQEGAYSPGRILLHAANARKVAPLRLAEAIPESMPGVPTVPSVGSAGHHVGLCKPCDFTGRSGGCREGAACKFCHLCGPDVSRRRKKERQQFINAMKQCQKAAMASCVG